MGGPVPGQQSAGDSRDTSPGGVMKEKSSRGGDGDGDGVWDGDGMR